MFHGNRTAARISALAFVGILTIGSAAFLSGCGSSEAQTTPPAPVPLGPPGTAFWDVFQSPPADAKAGDILYAQERLDPPPGGKGWNVVYVSEIQPGKLAYVSGEIYVPTAASAGPRDVVLWNHPTTGLADACAPSRNNVRNAPPVAALGIGEYQAPALDALIAQGHVVVMSDYPGQGLPGPAYYMAGQPNARASLDMLRVAQKFPQANASKRYVMFGWSQGGQTTMWAEAIASTYAPEFEGLGAALIAPAVRIRDLTLRSMTHPALAGYVISTLPGIRAYFPELKYGDFLTTEGLEQFPALADGCRDIWQTAATVKAPYQPGALAEGSPWWGAMTVIDDFRPKGSMPFVIYQGSADATTPVSLTLRERAALCAAGSAVEYKEFTGLDHLPIVSEAIKLFPAWTLARFKGELAPSNCNS